MLKYTPKFFRDGLPEWKRRKDPILSQLFYRPVSFFFSSVFASLGVSANGVSYFSALVAVVAVCCFVGGQPVAGALLINLWLILDCSDGNIARSVKKERFGDFADSLSSYICVGLMFVGIGYSVYGGGGLLFSPGRPEIILIGALTGSSDSLMRLVHQKFQNSQYRQGLPVGESDDPAKASPMRAMAMQIDAYMSIGGFLPIVVLICALLGALDAVVLIWCLYYGAMFVAYTILLVRKTFQANAIGGID